MNFLRSLQLAREGMLRAPEGVAEGTQAATTTPEATSFSLEYVRELRAENKGWRLKAHQMETAASEAKTAAERAAAEAKASLESGLKSADEKVSAATKAFNDRLVRAEAKAGATAAGLAHADFLKLIDTSAITVGDDGEVKVPESFWADAKAKLPHLFATTGADTGTTSQTQPAPKAAPTTTKHVSQMTDAEAAAAEAAMIAATRR